MAISVLSKGRLGVLSEPLGGCVSWALACAVRFAARAQCPEIVIGCAPWTRARFPMSAASSSVVAHSWRSSSAWRRRALDDAQHARRAQFHASLALDRDRGPRRTPAHGVIILRFGA